MNDSNIKSSLCMFCGKKGRGTCASLGQTICAYCCGTKRNEAINCSKDCEHNPLSIKGYDNYLRIDKGLIVKMLDYVLASIGKEKFEKIMGKMTFSDEGGNASITDAAAGAMNYMLFVERDARGMTLAQKWESENWNGLTNDEKTLIKYNMNSSLTVIEVQKILDNQTMECIDMLGDENKKFIVLDHNMAPHFTRFARMFVWIAHYPNFSRALNNGIELTSFVEREFMEDLYIGYRKARDKNEWLTVRQYLAKNYGKLVQNIFDINREKAKRILQKMDVHQCKAIYEIKGDFNKIKSILDTYPDFEARKESPEGESSEGSYYYDWLRRGESKALEKKMPGVFRHDEDESMGVGTLGNVVLNQNSLVVEVFTKQKFSFAKKMVEKYFKDLVVLKNELVVDLAKQVANKDSISKDKHLSGKEVEIPHEVRVEIMQKFNKNFYTKFLDDHVPALNGMTPREAAKDKKMRPALVELMKSHLKGIEMQNKNEELGLNIDWVLDELKLDELK